MEKIIYLYRQTPKKQKMNIQSRIHCFWRGTYQTVEQELCFLGNQVDAYGIMCGTKQEHSHKFRRTLRKLEKQIAKKDRQKEREPVWSERDWLYGWEACVFPPEMQMKFYEDCRRRYKRAEQLIVLDESLPEVNTYPEMNVTIVSHLYNEYNYVTIVTDREEVWEDLIETAYEEYGLFIRCVTDDIRLCFREKKTLILDLSITGKKCCRNFPGNSVYVDFYETPEKSRLISVKCRKIPYLSMHNALDTMLKCTV